MSQKLDLRAYQATLHIMSVRVRIKGRKTRGAFGGVSKIKRQELAEARRRRTEESVPYKAQSLAASIVKEFTR